MRYKTVTVDVDIDLSEFNTDDLLEELDLRGHGVASGPGPYNSKELVEQIWMLQRNGRDYQRQLDDLIYTVTGCIV